MITISIWKLSFIVVSVAFGCFVVGGCFANLGSN